MLKQSNKSTFCVYALIDPCVERRSVFYIGKARDNTLSQVRWRHIRSQNNPRKFHTIKKLMKEGHDVTLQVLRSRLIETRAFELEILLIGTLPKLGFDLVNLTKGGEGASGYKHKKSVCIQRSRRMKQDNPMKKAVVARRAAASKMKPVAQYSLDGNLIAKYPGAVIAESELGIAHQHISSCCRGTYKSAGGYVWRFATWC